MCDVVDLLEDHLNDLFLMAVFKAPSWARRQHHVGGLWRVLWLFMASKMLKLIRSWGGESSCSTGVWHGLMDYRWSIEFFFLEVVFLVCHLSRCYPPGRVKIGPMLGRKHEYSYIRDGFFATPPFQTRHKKFLEKLSTAIDESNRWNWTHLLLAPWRVWTLQKLNRKIMEIKLINPWWIKHW